MASRGSGRRLSTYAENGGAFKQPRHAHHRDKQAPSEYEDEDDDDMSHNDDRNPYEPAPSSQWPPPRRTDRQPEEGRQPHRTDQKDGRRHHDAEYQRGEFQGDKRPPNRYERPPPPPPRDEDRDRGTGREGGKGGKGGKGKNKGPPRNNDDRGQERQQGPRAPPATETIEDILRLHNTVLSRHDVAVRDMQHDTQLILLVHGDRLKEAMGAAMRAWRDRLPDAPGPHQDGPATNTLVRTVAEHLGADQNDAVQRTMGAWHVLQPASASSNSLADLVSNARRKETGEWCSNSIPWD